MIVYLLKWNTEHQPRLPPPRPPTPLRSASSNYKGTAFALQRITYTHFPTLTPWRRAMIEDQNHSMKEKTDASMSLETVIAMGLFGWIALSMTMMGLGIW